MRIHIENTMIDLKGVSIIEISIIRHNDGTYRLWVNGPEGCLLRAYDVKDIEFSHDCYKVEEDDGLRDGLR